jgi:hypothetical protein
MNRLESAVFSKAVTYVTSYLQADEKIQVIEPLTCMIRLAILAFKPKGTKVCIYENAIYIQEPSIFQGTIRWLSGDNRSDLHYLLSPIHKSIQRYDASKDESIKYIYEVAVRGLVRLKTGYSGDVKSSLTAHSIDLYINLIKDSIAGKKPKELKERNDDENSSAYNSFTSLWTSEQIVLIRKLFQQAEKNRNDSNSYLEAIENILSTKVRCAKEILVKNMQSI